MQLKVDAKQAAQWDEALKQANKCYRKRCHNLCCDNCHSHVAMTLRNFAYNGSNSHNMLTVWFYTVLRSRFVR